MIYMDGRKASIALASIAALALSGCESSGSYRVGSVGTASSVAPERDTADNGGGGSGNGSSGSGSGGSSSSGSGAQGGLGSNLLVTSGNAMIGAAGTSANLGIPGSGTVTGTVNGVLRSTGQTLVELGSGNTLILDGTGGKLGDVVSIDLGEGKVVGGPSGSSLVGLDVLARNPSTGRLASVGAGTGGNLVSVTVPGTTTSTAGGLLNGVTSGNTLGLVNGLPGANAGVNGTVNSAVGNVNTTVNGVVNPQGNTGVGATLNAVTQPVTGALGVNVNAPKPKP